MTADFDRDVLWDEVRGWASARCRERFKRTLLFPGESAKRLATRLVDGRRLTPEEGTWLVLLGLRRMPAWLVVDTDATPEDVYARFYPRVSKAFQRCNAQICTIVKCVPSSGLSQTTNSVEGNGFVRSSEVTGQ